MLDGLDQLPWPEIHHAYGTCENVPKMLRELAAGDTESSNVLGWLAGRCFHQETHYEANRHILPFLLEIVSRPNSPRRGGTA